ncbi:MAG TPA: NCS2 family permease [bacterium]|nr:NCS2 family permease [bacterium]HPQ65875.1 NCS2 family permease [bacterium]
MNRHFLSTYFGFAERRTDLRTEIGAGITTFTTLAYIIFVQPAVLSGKMFGFDSGLDFGAVMTATCLSGALATLLMGVLANYPIAQAPGMGENFFFVLTVVAEAGTLAAVRAGETTAWQVALGVVFISGVIFLILSLCRVRRVVIEAVSPSLRNGIAVGIGIFIAFIGLQNAKIVVADPGTLIGLNPRLHSLQMLVFGFVFLVTLALMTRRVRGAILWGILSGLALSLILGRTRFSGAVVAPPPSLSPTFLKFDLVHALSPHMWSFIVIFLFMDVFDTLGTLIGVSEQAGFIKDNRLPRADRALVSDAVGTVVGAAMGTSTVTSFIESITGVAYGGRTGFTSVVTAGCFLAALFFSPVVGMVTQDHALTAPALIVVGAMMIRNVRKVQWDDLTEGLPAFLVMVGIPLCYSIADGIAWGFVSYPAIKLLAGRGREVHWPLYPVAGLFLAKYLIF